MISLLVILFSLAVIAGGLYLVLGTNREGDSFRSYQKASRKTKTQNH